MFQVFNKKKNRRSARNAKQRERMEIAKNIKLMQEQEALRKLQIEFQSNKRIRCANRGLDDELITNAVTTGNFTDVENILKKENEDCSQETLNKCLLTAAKTGQKFTMTLLIKTGAQIECCDEDGNTPLMICAQLGYLDMVKILVANKADRNKCNKFGDTALLLAVNKNGSADMTRYILTSTNVNVKNPDGLTALMKAIQMKDMDIIKVLIWNGADVEDTVDQERVEEMGQKNVVMKYINLFSECKNHSDNFLISAVKTRDIFLVETVLTMNPDIINQKNSSNEHAIDVLLKMILTEKLCITDADKNIIKLLLSRGIDVKKQTNKRYMMSYYESTLVLAALIGDIDVVRWLCIYGAQVNDPSALTAAAKKGFLEIVNYLLSKEADIDAKCSEGTAFDLAVKYGHWECAKRLLEEKARYGMSEAYKIAIEKKLLNLVKHLVETFTIDLNDTKLFEWAIDSGDKDILEYLIEQGMDVNSSFFTQHHYYQGYVSPIHKCVSKEQIELLEVLIKNNTDINITDFNGESALFYACRLKDVLILQILLESSADVNFLNKSGETPLFAAIGSNHIEHVRLLLDHGAEVNFFNKYQETPLSRAIESKNFRIVSTLLEWNADTGVRVKDGKNCLMLTVLSTRYNYSGICEKIFNKLLEYSLDFNQQDDNGNTALMFACQESSAKAVQLLLNHGSDVNLINNEGKSALSISFRHDYDITKMLLLRKAKFMSARECQQAVLMFVANKKESLIPLALGQGVYPFMVKPENLCREMFNNIFLYERNMTPFSLAVCRSKHQISKYLLEARFLTKFDASFLLSKDFRLNVYLKGDPLYSLLSLQTLAFIEISDLLGATPDREKKVEQLPVPNKIKQNLLFRDCTLKLEDFEEII